MANEQLNQLLDDALARHDETLAQFGGPAPVHLAGGGLPAAPKVGVKGTARDALDAIKAEYDQYAKDADIYNTALSEYKTTTYDPYVAEVGKYNTALDDYKTKVYNPYAEKVTAYNNSLDKYKQELYNPYLSEVEKYNNALAAYTKDTYDPYIANVGTYNTALEKYNTDVYTPYSTALDAYNKAAEEWNAGPRTTPFAQTAPTLAKTFDLTAPTAPAAFAGTVPTAPTAFADTAPTAPDAFAVTAPTLAKTFDKTAPTTPKTSQEEYDKMVAASRQDVVNRQQALDVASNPEAYGLTINKLFSHGGAVHRAEGSPEEGEGSAYGPVTARRILQSMGEVGSDIGRGAVSNAESLLRGAVSQVPGTLGDLEALARKGINFSFGPGGVKVDEKTYAPTSEEIRAAVPRGTTARPESAGMESLGEVMAPGFAKAAAPVAKTVGKEAGRQILRGMEGEGPLRAVSPPVAFAVKPRGGTFASSGSLDAPPLSKFDEMLDSYATRAQQEVPDESKDLVKDFIDKKARKYFTTEYGTGSDTLRNAIRTGDMPVLGRDVERFPPYLLHAAKDPSVPGHEMAKQHLEKAYDNAANMEGHVLGLINSSDADARRMFQEHMRQTREQQRQLMSAEGLPDAYQNPSLSSHTLSDLEAYPSSTGAVRRLLEAGEQGTLPSGVQGALQRQQPVYDIRQPYMEFLNPRTVAENIAALPPNKLKNMSFADAMIEGNKKLQVFRDYDTAISKAERGGNLPKEVTEMYTKPFLKGDTGEWRQITEPRATDLEGKLMGHSVGGYREGETYGTTYTGLPYGGKKAFEEGLVKVYSLRNEKGQPTVTLEMAKSDGGKGDKWNITQIRGPFNSEPAKNQWDDIFKLIDKGGDHIGTIKQNSYSMDRTGQGVANGTVVDWGREYDSWKNGIPSENYAKGGSVERKTSDNRRYL